MDTIQLQGPNTIDLNATPDQWNQNNRAFVVGNGFDTNAAQRSDAFTIWFNDATLQEILT